MQFFDSYKYLILVNLIVDNARKRKTEHGCKYFSCDSYLHHIIKIKTHYIHTLDTLLFFTLRYTERFTVMENVARTTAHTCEAIQYNSHCVYGPTLLFWRLKTCIYQSTYAVLNSVNVLNPHWVHLELRLEPSHSDRSTVLCSAVFRIFLNFFYSSLSNSRQLKKVKLHIGNTQVL